MKHEFLPSAIFNNHIPHFNPCARKDLMTNGPRTIEPTIRDHYLTNVLDEVDATVFSGDRLYNKRSLAEFKHCLKRWGKEAESIEEFLKVDL